ncbi:MAG TPA: hypothetical protein DEP66_03575 [Acidimicrobiaceae bacterium]|nr:hypothetical protein [Acidimicrobiaceae bacterium]HCB37294.1 hypothetical protein [Acidimicrobiaceae bacterium]
MTAVILVVLAVAWVVVLVPGRKGGRGARRALPRRTRRTRPTRSIGLGLPARSGATAVAFGRLPAAVSFGRLPAVAPLVSTYQRITPAQVHLLQQPRVAVAVPQAAQPGARHFIPATVGDAATRRRDITKILLAAALVTLAVWVVTLHVWLGVVHLGIDAVLIGFRMLVSRRPLS